MRPTGRPYSRLTAAGWADGVIAGTGIIGAVLYGTPERHTIVFSHERFFVPANNRRPAPELAPVLDEIRQALARRDERAAADVVEGRLHELGWDTGELIWTDPLGPVAQLEWIVDDEADWSEYRREISLTSGDVAIGWEVPAKGRRGLSLFTVHGEESILVELWSDDDVSGRLVLGPVTETAADIQVIAPVDYSRQVRAETGSSMDEQVVHISADGVEMGTGIQAWARLLPESAQFQADEGGWRVAVSAGTRQRFRVRLATSAEPLGYPEEIEVDEALATSRLVLGASVSAGETDPVEAIWDRARHGDEDAERAVFELAYAAGRRNIVASTGVLPPTLQGVWQGTWSPAWSADYTLNGNLQLGGVADILWTGNPALMRSVLRLVFPFIEDFRSNARNVFGLPGMLLPARLTTHGHANHFQRDYPHQFWLGSGPWLLRLVADYVQVTGDLSILDDRVWTLTTEILGFSMAVLDAGQGFLSPSYSPENTPAGSENPLATDAASDIAAIRDGLSVGAWFADLRGDEERAIAWRAARDRLPAYRVAPDGTLAEWCSEWPEQIAHRHASQLQGLWYEPGPELLRGELAQAALATIRAKIAWRAESPTGPPGRMEMAFGLTSLGLAAAQLGDSDAAHQCALWLARDHFTPALTSTHDAGNVFNLDASGGLPALVSAMLVGSRRGRLRLLPALPVAWPSGRITGLTGRGAVMVDSLAWDQTSVSAGLRLPVTGAWLRPDGVSITLPRPGRLVRSAGVEQLDPKTVQVGSDVTAVSFRFDMTA